jgi:hypothetical protein
MTFLNNKMITLKKKEKKLSAAGFEARSLIKDYENFGKCSEFSANTHFIFAISSGELNRCPFLLAQNTPTA